jgi:hypothetical protein
MNYSILSRSSLFQGHRMTAIGILLGHDEYFYDLLFDSKGRPYSRKDELINQLNPQDKLILHASLDIWNHSGKLNFADCLIHWDSSTWVRFNHAITYFTETQDDLMESVSHFKS